MDELSDFDVYYTGIRLYKYVVRAHLERRTSSTLIRITVESRLSRSTVPFNYRCGTIILRTVRICTVYFSVLWSA